jgi:hypothetical protein
MPLGWRLTGLLRLSDTDDWEASAAGPLVGQLVQRRASQPEQALRLLADDLRRLRGPVTG